MAQVSRPAGASIAVVPFLGVGRVRGGVPLAVCSGGQPKARTRQAEIFRRLLGESQTKLRAGQRIKIETHGGGSTYILMDTTGQLMACAMHSGAGESAYTSLSIILRRGLDLCNGDVAGTSDEVFSERLEPLLQDLMQTYMTVPAAAANAQPTGQPMRNSRAAPKLFGGSLCYKTSKSVAKKYGRLEQGRLNISSAQGGDVKFSLNFSESASQGKPWAVETTGPSSFRLTHGSDEFEFDTTDCECSRDEWVHNCKLHINYASGAEPPSITKPPGGKQSRMGGVDSPASLVSTTTASTTASATSSIAGKVVVMTMFGNELKTCTLQCKVTGADDTAVRATAEEAQIRHNLRELEKMLAEFEVVLERAEGLSVGVERRKINGVDTLVVNGDDATLVQAWNKEHPDLMAKPGDQVVEINGATDMAAMVQQLKGKAPLKVRLYRMPAPLPQAAPPPQAVLPPPPSVSAGGGGGGEELAAARKRIAELEAEVNHLKKQAESFKSAEAKAKAQASNDGVLAEARNARDRGDTAGLRAAIAKARIAGITNVADLESALAALEIAEAALTAALDSAADGEMARAAVERARASGICAERLVEAEAKAAAIAARATVKQALEVACAEGTKEALRQALEAARAAGLGPADLAQAEKLLQDELERDRLLTIVYDDVEASKQVDMKSLEAVKAAKDKLADAIAAALEKGVREVALADAEFRRKKLHNTIEDLKGSIRVFCRIRPLSRKELDQGDRNVTRQIDAMTIEITDEDARAQVFQFDAVFTPGTQEQIFEDCKDLVQSAADGYNVTIFAYGQTGAGKTFTMAGCPGQEGVSPRTIGEIYRVVAAGSSRFDYKVRGSMLELHRQDLVDLLAKGDLSKKTRARPLNVRTEKGSVVIDNLIEEDCINAEELALLLARGNDQRTVAATEMNSESSRSHLILIIKIVSTNKETGEVLQGKILIVDLAGSERLKKSQTTADMQKESIEINKSLTALGDVIEALTKGQKQIPYRNHKLTQLMQDSLGGTAKTLMFVNCSPAHSNVDESTNSLKYAQRAKKITNTATKG